MKTYVNLTTLWAMRATVPIRIIIIEVQEKI